MTLEEIRQLYTDVAGPRGLQMHESKASELAKYHIITLQL